MVVDARWRSQDVASTAQDPVLCAVERYDRAGMPTAQRHSSSKRPPARRTPPAQLAWVRHLEQPLFQLTPRKREVPFTGLFRASKPIPALAAAAARPLDLRGPWPRPAGAEPSAEEKGLCPPAGAARGLSPPLHGALDGEAPSARPPLALPAGTGSVPTCSSGKLSLPRSPCSLAAVGARFYTSGRGHTCARSGQGALQPLHLPQLCKRMR